VERVLGLSYCGQLWCDSRRVVARENEATSYSPGILRAEKVGPCQQATHSGVAPPYFPAWREKLVPLLQVSIQYTALIE